MSKDGEEDNL